MCVDLIANNQAPVPRVLTAHYQLLFPPHLSGWRLFDDSTVTMVDESQVVTRYAYVLFYRRRNSPVERPPRFLRPVGAESPTAVGATASQVREPHSDTEGLTEGCPGLPFPIDNL